MWQGESKPAQGRAGQQGQPEDKVIQALEDQGEDDPYVAHIALSGWVDKQDATHTTFRH